MTTTWLSRGEEPRHSGTIHDVQGRPILQGDEVVFVFPKPAPDAFRGRLLVTGVDPSHHEVYLYTTDPLIHSKNFPIVITNPETALRVVNFKKPPKG